MSTIALAAALVALLAAVLLLAIPILRRQRLQARSPRRILFPFLGRSVSRAALDAALRISRAETATLIPAYLATLPFDLSLEAPIPKECGVAMPLLEAIEQRATRLGIPVETRIERGRTSRHALIQLIQHERYDRVVLPARTSRTEGFTPDDIAWLLEHAPGEVTVIRPATEAPRSTPLWRRLARQIPPESTSPTAAAR